jgi:hypothetical protein
MLRTIHNNRRAYNAFLRSKEVKYSKQIRHLHAVHPYESVKPICEVAADDYLTFRVETCV